MPDCEDLSDENECSTVTCVENYFKCDKNKCIPDNKLCDNQTDCDDATDEKYCDCGPLFQCKSISKKCLPVSSRCNGISECEDGSDEIDCNLKLCKYIKFKV